MEDVIPDIDMAPVESTITTQEIVSKWKEQFEKNTLTSTEIEEHWRVWVPKIYTPAENKNCLDWSFDEDLAQTVLFAPLEQFICNGDPSKILTELRQTDKPSSVCGRVFKNGEPTYSCRECGVDNTCVLCVDCFKKSKHRFHKYKMGTSSGGGCCDCGDAEAWKSYPWCDIHVVGTTSTQEEQPKIGLPEDLKERTGIIFESVLWYAFSLLSTEQISNITLGSTSDNFFDIDNYCTILYNDEIHTFEQVISTLTRVLKCNHRTAIAFVTNIDRGGRAVVKCSSFKECFELRQEIEKYTSRHGNKPLKVIVSHAYIIAHQIFAMKLLTWLQDFLGHGEGFRSIFAEMALAPKPTQPCIIKGILMRDSTLWKSARTQWHRLLIAGMLMEYENKNKLAKIFTRNYGQVLKEFIRDDHDHSFSVSSLSVQLFTVPTIAHLLIAHDDIFFMLLNTFNSECKSKCNQSGKLEFERSPAGHTFKRAQYMLYDLRYLLNSVPEQWTDDLRKSFLHGLYSLFDLLVMMQGMDCVTRQVGQHMEYEPEWESAFNLHIKLAYCISLAIKWCGTDKVVLVKAYKAALQKLEAHPCYEPNEAGEMRELADHSATCLHYDVSSKPVSIHLPLTRFLAGLHLYLEQHNLSYDGPEFQGMVKPTPVQIIEPVLRAQVMIAQVNAGMWRRNGYGLLNQLYFYHNVKCRTEMLDRDISALQVGASLIESNEFLIHVLNKFNLINWASINFEINTLKSPEEDSMRQTINMVEEFLQLMIVLIGERYVPGISGITTEDRIKKEIIQHLCIKPLPHSELNKNIPDDLAHETALDNVIQDLAVFRKPTQTNGKGVYELKDEFYNNYNVFFYHYTKEELSKSEENQRQRRKNAKELECCPPPLLPKVNESFCMIVNLLQCDVMLHCMQTIFVRCMNLRARSFSELQLHKILHLIGYALQEEESKQYPFFKFIENSTKMNILPLMEACVNCPRVDAHKDLLKWTIHKYKQLSNQLDLESNSSGTESKAADVVLVDTEKARRAKMAAERRAKIMAQMTTQQKNFMKDNAKMFEETSSDSTMRKESFKGSDMDITETCDDVPVALGPHQTARLTSEKTYVCILCQEEETVSLHGPSLVLAAFVQQATVLCQHRTDDELMDVSKHDPLYLHSNLGPAPHTATCGHVMHSVCWRKYFDSVMLKEHRRPYRLRHPASFDVDKQEFLCPLCECLSNTVIPLVPPLATMQTSATSGLSFEDCLEYLTSAIGLKEKVCHGEFKCTEACTNVHCAACANASSENDADVSEICEVNCTPQPHQVFYRLHHNKVTMPERGQGLYPSYAPKLSESLTEMVQLFAQVAYTRGLNVQPVPNDKKIAPMAWKTLSYTTHSIEVLLRNSNKPLLGHLSSRQRDCLESLVRVVGILGATWTNGFTIQSQMLHLLSILLEHHNDGPSVLQWDSLGFLIPLTYSLPSFMHPENTVGVPICGTMEWHTLRLIFVSHIVRLLILMNPKELEQPMDTGEASEHSQLSTVLKLMRKEDVNLSSVWSYVQKASIPFLRTCVLFYHYLTNVASPAVLTEVGGDTFENMCAYLSLPVSPKELFDGTHIMGMVNKWVQHEEVQLFLNGVPLQVVQEPLPISRLIELPTDYSELINTVSSFTCPKSDNEDARNPTMCLVCGEILCSQSYCCQTEVNKLNIGACNFHAHKCGAGVGVFLRVRDCEILFLATPYRGCFMPPPYLDDYGETDQGLRRGNPLRLCETRYQKLQTLWLSHSIHEEIARAIESSNHIVATQWHHL